MFSGTKKSKTYILEWNLENPSVWILAVPLSLKGSSNCSNQVNVHKLYAVEYINTLLLIICDHLHDLYTLNSLSDWKGLKKFTPRDSLNSPLIYILFSMYKIMGFKENKILPFSFGKLLHQILSRENVETKKMF